MSRDSKSIVIIGAGISGLTTAYFLREKGFRVTVLEAAPEVGGTMKTLHRDGWLIETGPNSALETTPLFTKLISELDLREEHLYANRLADKRYILRHGRLYAIPMSPSAFIQTRLWSLAGKLRLLKEPFVGSAKSEETIAEFVRRRLGQEFLDYAINPFVAGVYAGNPEELSIRYSFPKLFALEEKYGGLIKGMIKGRKERKQRAEKAKDRAKLFSFREGMASFPEAIARSLGNDVRVNTSVHHIIPMRMGAKPVYHVSCSADGNRETIEAVAVVLTVPAYAASEIIRPIDPEMATSLASIYYPPVAEVFLGYKSEQIKRTLDGFGFLIPARENRRILGTIWSSVLFPGRSPEGHVAFTTFVGGSRQPQLTALDDTSLLSLVKDELSLIMGVDQEPVFSHISRWNQAIPQYNMSYGKVLQAMERFEENFRGAFLSGNYRGGISVGDCIMSAELVSERIQTMFSS